uniref:Uncharacterized protein n=1 Tax=Glossina pallidipes TaxID=7398 RepID=A0A1A9Z9S1_GLOPL
MSEASFKALEDFISPSAAITLARASLAASASAAIALCKAVGKETSLLRKKRKKVSLMIRYVFQIFFLISFYYISTRSTLTPHGSVASSKDTCIVCEIASRSVNNSERLRVPKTFLNVVAANKRVE